MSIDHIYYCKLIIAIFVLLLIFYSWKMSQTLAHDAHSYSGGKAINVHWASVQVTMWRLGREERTWSLWLWLRWLDSNNCHILNKLINTSCTSVWMYKQIFNYSMLNDWSDSQFVCRGQPEEFHLGRHSDLFWCTCCYLYCICKVWRYDKVKN